LRVINFFRSRSSSSGANSRQNTANRAHCPEDSCKATVISTAERVRTHDDQISKLFETTKKISEDVAFMRGKLSGAKIVRFQEE